MEKCKHCEFLTKTFYKPFKNNYDYWIFTEVFVYTHKGKDYCNKSKKKNLRYYIVRLKNICHKFLGIVLPFFLRS